MNHVTLKQSKNPQRWKRILPEFCHLENLKKSKFFEAREPSENEAQRKLVDISRISTPEDMTFMYDVIINQRSL